MGHRATLRDALRYGKLTAAAMPHEKLKLCFMIPESKTFFSVEQPNDPQVHVIAASYRLEDVLLRPKTANGPVFYETCLLGEYGLESEPRRNSFHTTLNLLHAYHTERTRGLDFARRRNVKTDQRHEITNGYNSQHRARN